MSKQKQRKQFLYTTCCELVFFLEINEQSLVLFWVNSRIRAFDTDLPVYDKVCFIFLDEENTDLYKYKKAYF